MGDPPKYLLTYCSTYALIAHSTAINARNLLRSCANAFTGHEVVSAAACSRSVDLLHEFFGRPCLLWPSGFQSTAYAAISLRLPRVWPIHTHFHRKTDCSTCSVCVICHSSSLLTLIGQRVRSIRLRHRFTNIAAVEEDGHHVQPEETQLQISCETGYSP